MLKNFVAQLVFKKTSSLGGDAIGQTHDFLLWASKDRDHLKIRKVFSARTLADDIGGRYSRVEMQSGLRGTAHDLRVKLDDVGADVRIYRHDNLTSQSGTERSQFPIDLDGISFTPGRGYWKTNEPGTMRLKGANRIAAPTDRSISYVRYFNDFPMTPITDIWLDTQTGAFTDDKVYAVQTGTKVVERCMLMTTDPGTWCSIQPVDPHNGVCG